MKNTLNRRILVLAVSMLIMTAPLAQGIRSIAPGENPARTQINPLPTVRQKPIVLAENEENTAENKTQTAIDTKDQAAEPEPDPESDNKDPATKSKTTPLKSFRPSEEIAAEQAVDFPVDI
jgi:hypothetical protein